MYSRYFLVLCAFVLFVAVFPTQAEEPSQTSIIDKIRETAERLIHDSFVGLDHAVTCLKEAGQHCKDLLKHPLINYVRCAGKYLKDNQERCKKGQ